jgi:hypothetical protein
MRLTTWKRVLLEKLIVTKLIKKFLLLWNSKVHYQVYKILPLVPILSEMNPVHTFHSYFLRSILILSSYLCLGLMSGFFPSGFLKILYALLISIMHVKCPTHLILLNMITLISGEVYKLWSSSLCSLLQAPSQVHIFSSAPCSSLSVRDQLSHPYKDQN